VSDQAAEFTASRVMKWLRDRSAGPSFISWRQFYNYYRQPYSALGYLAPAQFLEQSRNIGKRHATIVFFR